MRDLQAFLNNLRSEGRLRTIPGEPPESLIDLTLNDYLAIAARGELQRNFISQFAASDFPPLTSVASRLLASRQREYSSLENTLAEAYGRPALLFNSGYHANVGCVSALAGDDTLMLSDKLIHASMIDGLKIGRAQFKRFAHNDMDALRRLLELNRDKHADVWILTESIFSMDGDLAPLHRLVALKHEFPGVHLYLDEAHAVGARGATGLGLAEEEGLLHEIDLLIGTFGKALASAGAFAICSEQLRDFLINTSRSFIFSTALPPMSAAYSEYTFRTMRSMREERARLKELGTMLMTRLNLPVPAAGSSHIVPYLMCSNARAVAMAAALRDSGFMAMPIRKPTVAAGTERIRFSLNASLTEADISRLAHEVLMIEDTLNHTMPLS